MRRALIATSVLLVSTVAWMTDLVTSPGPFSPDAGALLGADLVVVGAVAATAITLGHARWALRTGVTTATAGLALALVLPVDGPWVVAVAASGTALVLLTARWTGAIVRGRPAAAGPPREAVLLSLLLLVLPGVAALLGWRGLGPAHWLVVVAAVAGLFVYTRALPGALVAVRWAMPAVLVVATVLDRGPARVAWLVAAAAVGGLAWRPGVRLAVRPLARQGTAVPILPELVPQDVLDAAGVDERGRPKT